MPGPLVGHDELHHPDDLLEPIRIGSHRLERRCRLDPNAQALPQRRRPNGVEGGVDDPSNIRGLDLQRQVPRDDA